MFPTENKFVNGTVILFEFKVVATFNLVAETTALEIEVTPLT
jgi:hypothetical protein